VFLTQSAQSVTTLLSLVEAVGTVMSWVPGDLVSKAVILATDEATAILTLTVPSPVLVNFMPLSWQIHCKGYGAVFAIGFASVTFTGTFTLFSSYR
jgi:hypothetical protein